MSEHKKYIKKYPAEQYGSEVKLMISSFLAIGIGETINTGRYAPRQR